MDTFSYEVFELQNKQNPDWKEYKLGIANCMQQCESSYNKLLNHQIKGAEISFYTFEKQIKKCKDFKSEDPVKLLSCYNYKIGKLSSRFGFYYLNQRNNLIDRLKENKV